MNKKTLIIILAAVLAVLLSLMYVYYDATFLAQYDYKVSYLNLTHPDTVGSGLRILYLTDLEYGTHTDESHLERITRTVQSLDYDLVLFGGDVFDEDYTPVGEDISTLVSFFSSFKAPDGRFAIQGDYDLISESRQNIAAKILNDSGFEIITGSVPIYLTSSRYFIICGCPYDSQPQQPLDGERLNIVMIHDLSLRGQFTDAALILCGNSHDRQLNWPFSGRYRLGYHENDRLYYSSGLGMTKTAHRLFCDPEVVIITLN